MVRRVGGQAAGSSVPSGLTRGALPSEAALKAITVAPAKLLGAGQRVGSIAPGRDGDLLLLNGEPLEFTTQVEAVMIDGRLYE